MAISDRNKNGKRTDYARHYSFIDAGSPVCGTKGYGYSSSDVSDVDCEKCTIWLLNEAIRINNLQKQSQ